MLLRRVSQHVKEQNWFAVGIDFFIVILGVFMGIQVANWNEERSEAVRERQVLYAILEDLRADSVQLESSVSMVRVNLSASQYLFDLMGGDSLSKMALPVLNPTLGQTEIEIPELQAIPEFEKAYLWKLITVHYYSAQSDAALGSLIAAGDLGLIKDAGLVRELQQYQLLWRAMEMSNNLTFRPFRDRAVFVGQRFGLSPFSAMDEQALLALFKQNPELVGAARTLADYTVLQHSTILRLAEQTDLLISRIESAVGIDAS